MSSFFVGSVAASIPCIAISNLPLSFNLTLAISFFAFHAFRIVLRPVSQWDCRTRPSFILVNMVISSCLALSGAGRSTNVILATVVATLHLWLQVYFHTVCGRSSLFLNLGCSRPLCCPCLFSKTLQLCMWFNLLMTMFFSNTVLLSCFALLLAMYIGSQYEIAIPACYEGTLITHAA